MSFLENRIPPAIVLLFFMIVIRVVAWFDPVIQLGAGYRYWGAGVLLMLGMGFAIAGVLSFRRAKTTVNPLKPDLVSDLVTIGVYQFTRNPMYLGMLLVALAWTVFHSSVLGLAGVFGFKWFITRFQIMPEERAIAAQFKEEYAHYKASVRRWL